MRSGRDKILSGVCGGFAETYDLDPTLVRVGFVVFTLVTGLVVGLVLYVVVALVAPEAPASPAPPPA